MIELNKFYHGIVKYSNETLGSGLDVGQITPPFERDFTDAKVHRRVLEIKKKMNKIV